MMLCLSSVFLALFILFINLSPSMPSLLARQTPQQYYLRTAVYTSNGTNDTGTLKENLYVQAYHVGAGFNDVVLKPNISDSVPGYLNSTIDPVSGETTKITSLPPIVVNGEEIYWEMCAISANDNWGTMQINLGEVNCNDFYADGDLLIHAAGLWLACDWLDDVGSQLFYVSGFEAGELRAPSSCSYVDLVMVPVDDFRVYGPREPKRTRLKKD